MRPAPAISRPRKQAGAGRQPCCALEQWVARRSHKPQVGGSNPSGATKQRAGSALPWATGVFIRRRLLGETHEDTARRLAGLGVGVRLVGPLPREVVLKICRKCSALLDRAGCAACAKKYYAKWRVANAEKLKAYQARWSTANREKLRAYSAQRRANTPKKEKVPVVRIAVDPEGKRLARRAAREKWKAAHPVEHKLAQQKYALANKEKMRAAIKKWTLEHPENKKAIWKRWAERHPESDRIRKQNRLARKRNNGGRLSKGIVARLMKLQRGKCACGCGQELKTEYHIDHIIPLALGGPNADDNVQLLTKTCNLQKCAKHPIEFMQSRGFLL